MTPPTPPRQYDFFEAQNRIAELEAELRELREALEAEDPSEWRRLRDEARLRVLKAAVRP